jgi:hypothetical protein
VLGKQLKLYFLKICNFFLFKINFFLFLDINIKNNFLKIKKLIYFQIKFILNQFLKLENTGGCEILAQVMFVHCAESVHAIN